MTINSAIKCGSNTPAIFTIHLSMSLSEITVTPIPYGPDPFSNRSLVRVAPGPESLAVEHNGNLLIAGWDGNRPVAVGTIDWQHVKELIDGVDITGAYIHPLHKNEAIRAYQNDLSIQSSEVVLVTVRDPAPEPKELSSVVLPNTPTFTTEKIVTSVSADPTVAQAHSEVKKLFEMMFSYYTDHYQGMNRTEDLMILITEAMKEEYRKLRRAAESSNNAILP